MASLRRYLFASMNTMLIESTKVPWQGFSIIVMCIPEPDDLVFVESEGSIPP